MNQIDPGGITIGRDDGIQIADPHGIDKRVDRIWHRRRTAVALESHHSKHLIIILLTTPPFFYFKEIK